MTSNPVEYDKPLGPKVEALAGYGLTPDEIALVLAVEPSELKTAYGAELQSGAIKANARVAESLYRQATGEGRQAVTAAIFWLKTRARWKETHIPEHVGVPGMSILFKGQLQRCAH